MRSICAAHSICPAGRENLYHIEEMRRISISNLLQGKYIASPRDISRRLRATYRRAIGAKATARSNCPLSQKSAIFDSSPEEGAATLPRIAVMITVGGGSVVRSTGNRDIVSFLWFHFGEMWPCTYPKGQVRRSRGISVMLPFCCFAQKVNTCFVLNQEFSKIPWFLFNNIL